MDAPGAREKGLRVLLYAVNGTGLGHVTRLMAIGRWIRILLGGLNLECQAYFLSCSDADFVVGAEGFPSFKLPSKTVLRHGNISLDAAGGLIRGYAEAVLESLAPDVLVVDTFPTGSYDELLPLLGRDDVTKVYVFRKQRTDYARQVPYEKLLTTFDLLVVPHPEGAFELPFTPHPSLNVTWAGNVVFGEHNELTPRREARKALGIAARKTAVFVAAGGGGDPHSRQTLETIVESLSQVEGLQVIVGAGPLARELPQPRGNVSWTQRYPISRLFKAFDFAISSSGYNTVHELLFFGVPAILYAQERGADDQLARAERVAAAGAAIGVDPLTTETLQAAVERMLEPGFRRRASQAARDLVPENGARRAAEAIVDMAVVKRVQRQAELVRSVGSM